jgi:hypothetical protein
VEACGRTINPKRPSRSAQPTSRPRLKLRTSCVLTTRSRHSIKQQISARSLKRSKQTKNTTFCFFVLTGILNLKHPVGNLAVTHASLVRKRVISQPLAYQDTKHYCIYMRAQFVRTWQPRACIPRVGDNVNNSEVSPAWRDGLRGKLNVQVQHRPFTPGPGKMFVWRNGFLREKKNTPFSKDIPISWLRISLYSLVPPHTCPEST